MKEQFVKKISILILSYGLVRIVELSSKLLWLKDWSTNHVEMGIIIGLKLIAAVIIYGIAATLDMKRWQDVLFVLLSFIPIVNALAFFYLIYLSVKKYRLLNNS
jgi:hypothetical protein